MNHTTPDHPKPDWEGFGKAVMDFWPTGDLDGFDLQDLAEQFHIINEVPGGYDPDQHIGHDGVLDPGDPFYMENY